MKAIMMMRFVPCPRQAYMTSRSRGYAPTPVVAMVLISALFESPHPFRGTFGLCASSTLWRKSIRRIFQDKFHQLSTSSLFSPLTSSRKGCKAIIFHLCTPRVHKVTPVTVLSNRVFTRCSAQCGHVASFIPRFLNRAKISRS